MAAGTPKVNTAFNWRFKMVDAADFATPKTGLTVTVQVSKAAAAFAGLTGSPSVTEIANGWYTVTVAAGDMNTTDVILKATATGAAQTDEAFYLDDQRTSDVYSRIGAPAGASIAADIVVIDDFLDTEIAAIKAKTDNLPSDPADASDIAASHASITSAIAGVQSDTDNIQTRLPAALVGGRMDADVGNLQTAAVNQINDDSVVVRRGTAQAGAGGTITLDAGASAVTDFYRGLSCRIVSGTGAGQVRPFTAYNGTTKVGTVSENWATNPDNTSVFRLIADASLGALKLVMDDGTAVYDRTTDSLQAIRDRGDSAWGGSGGETRLREGTAQAGGANTITLDAGASATTDLYKNLICAIDSGTGAGQSEIITAYNGTTKVATIGVNWRTQPNATSHFRLLPLGSIPGASAPTTTDILNALKADTQWKEMHSWVRYKVVIDRSTGDVEVYDSGNAFLFKRRITELSADRVAHVPQ